MAKKFKPQPGQTVVYVQQKGNSHGCLIFSLVLMFFAWIPGIIALATLATWKLTKVAWNWTITAGIKWPAKAVKWSWVATLALCVWCWQNGSKATVWGVRQVRQLADKRGQRAQ